ncbi:MAG: molybdopterin-dependent oxidoreductase [Planctomycetes bacterium]|nr:molybdopterin-dependent oxidoreductase [Planctomycetota bacterium]
MEGVTRRGFLKGAGVAAGAFLLPGCGEEEDPYALRRPALPDGSSGMLGQEKWVPSVCGQCQAGCGIRVRVAEGRAVKIEGNPACPVNRGGLGPKGQAGLGMLYHPDRILAPRRRDGERGSGRWKEVGWDEAIGEIASVLRDLRARGEGRGVVVLDGEPRGMTRDLWARFLDAYGSPNHMDHRATSDGGKLLAMTYMHGVPEIPAYDWERTRYVLGFGASLFESWCQSIHLTRASSHLRRGMPGRRVKFVQVSPRFSVTAAKADEWVPIEPATYGALALGIGHVLVRDGIFDADFVRERSFGFEPWTGEDGRAHRGFRDVLAEYMPDRVEALTHVPARTVERLAHEMVDNRPAVALADGGAAAATNGLGTAMSIHALNALLGSLECPGGLLVQRPAPLASWAAVEPDDAARAGAAAPRLDGAGVSRPLARGCIQEFPEAVLSGKPYPARALFLNRSNPVFSKPGGGRWIEALRKVDLVVSFSPLPDESTIWADFVLPEPTYLERWEPVEPVPSVGYPILGLRQPVVDPPRDSLAVGDVVIRLARALGDPVARAFPWDGYRDAIVERLKGVQEAQTGSILEPTTQKFIRKLQQEGIWEARGYPFGQWEGAFPTASGKFEFFSQAIEKRLAAAFPDASSMEAWLVAQGVQTRGDDLCLPHWEPPQFAGGEVDYPFLLVAYRGVAYAEGGIRHLPRLRELPSAGRDAWRERVELNPSDAHRLGIRGGDGVRVETPAGRRRLTAFLHPGVRPGTAGLPLGYGEWPPRPGVLEAPGGYGLLAVASDPLAGIFALQGTRARIGKEA